MNRAFQKWCCILVSVLPLTGFCQDVKRDTIVRGRGSGFGDDDVVRPKSTIDHFVSFYPINSDPYIAFRTPMYKKEKMLFEASPDVKISVFNNIYSGLQDHKKYTWAAYIHFRPVLRMYNDNSKPVKTPSTPILLGGQVLRIQPRGESGDLRYKFRMYAVSLESGHYSNGQNGGAFTEKYEDGTQESEDVYKTIGPETNLSEILNRKSGNFSTNLTELKVNTRFIKTDSAFRIIRSHVVTAGFTHYHNRIFFIGDFGGYTPNDIKIYGRWITQAGYEFIKSPAKWKGMRFALSQNIEYIHGAHPWVEPFRSDTRFTLYPFRKASDFGFALSYIRGHDNYNYRFVDHGEQFGLTLIWSVFPPFVLNKPYK